MKELLLRSYDNQEIFVTIWDDVSSAKGVVQILHGMSEYAGRYDAFARYLNSRGYVVFADDHRAHGRTESDKDRGRHKGDVFKKTLNDALFFREWLKNEYELPVFLYGHSYGSFLAQAFAQQGTDVRAIAMTGSGYQKHAYTFGSIALAPIALVLGRWRPKMLNWFSDTFNTFKGDSGKHQWASSVRERREEVLDMPYMHVPMSVKFCFDMLYNTSRLYGKKALSRLNPATAIGIFSGGDDLTGNKGKGAKKLDEMYKSVGIKSELHIYEGARHEVIYDHCGQRVQQDIADFFDKFIMYEQTSIEDLVRR